MPALPTTTPLKALALLLPVVALATLVALAVWLRTDAGSTQAASGGPEMALTVKSSSGVFACEPGKCEVGLGETFTLAVEVVQAPANGYVLAQTFIQYGPDLTYDKAASAADEVVWPDCDASALARGQPDAGENVRHGCLTGFFPPVPKSNFTGNIVEIDLNCTVTLSQHLVELLPHGDPVAGMDGALFVEPDGVTQHVPKVNDLTVNCVTFPGCFTGETLIDTPQGRRPIAELAVGDEVLSYDHASGKFVRTHVKTLFSKDAGGYLVVTLADGTQIRVTPEHPFYDPATGEYRAVGTFAVGDHVIQPSEDGLAEVAITAIEQVDVPVRVYNIEVADENHNYVAAGALVHNKTPTVPPPPVGGVTSLSADLSEPGSSSWLRVEVFAGLALAAAALAGAAWYARRRGTA